MASLPCVFSVYALCGALHWPFSGQNGGPGANPARQAHGLLICPKGLQATDPDNLAGIAQKRTGPCRSTFSD